LSEGFSRYCATRGGTQILNIEFKGFDIEENKVNHVNFHYKDEDQQIDHDFKIHCDYVLCEPQYVKEHKMVESKGKVFRCICILKGDKPFKDQTGQIIFPRKQLNRNNDIFCVILDSEIEICPPEY